jgi:hypothetical protein
VIRTRSLRALAADECPPDAAWEAARIRMPKLAHDRNAEVAYLARRGTACERGALLVQREEAT